MENNQFDPQQWLSDDQNPPQPQAPAKTVAESHLAQVEALVSLIEQKQTDITSSYHEWCNVGFAFAGAFDEQGRDFFHRISRFYPRYDHKECDKQYDRCLKGKGSGITLRTVFFLAKNAGIALYQPNEEETKEEREEPIYMPNIPNPVFPKVPVFLQNVVKEAASDEERDILFLGALVAISSCLPNVYGIYDGRKVLANLYLFVAAPASAGKGRMVHCRKLVDPVHQDLRRQAKLIKRQHEMAMVEYNLKKGSNEYAEKPEKPGEKLLFIPANSSSTGAYQLLSDSEGRGLIFETEGDTLANAFKSDFGNYSDGFRKAFHHETISYYRRMDREYVDIPHPSLSAVLSGTPKQIGLLIPESENGLFSRFLFYSMNFKPQWRNVFSKNNGIILEEYFEQLGEEFFRLFEKLKNGPERMFCLTAHQEERFNQFFSTVQDRFVELMGMNYLATIRRLGLICFRLCMIMSMLRLMENKQPETLIVCQDDDFQNALDVISVLNQHSVKIFSEIMPQEEEKKLPKLNSRRQTFFNMLPDQFCRKDYVDLARTLEIPEKTADYIISFFMKKNIVSYVKRDHYKKVQLDVNPKKDQKTSTLGF